MCEVDSSGNVTAVNTVGATGVLARHVNGTGGSSTFYAFDPQGSVSLRLDTSGNILSSHVNEAWGTQVSTGSGYGSDPYAGYCGQWGYYRDVETGLHLLGHRYYDAGRGRFINRDPIGYGGGINLYAYCGSNPINGSDSTGFIHTDRMEQGGAGGQLEESVEDGYIPYGSGGGGVGIGFPGETGGESGRGGNSGGEGSDGGEECVYMRAVGQEEAVAIQEQYAIASPVASRLIPRATKVFLPGYEPWMREIFFDPMNEAAIKAGEEPPYQYIVEYTTKCPIDEFAVPDFGSGTFRGPVPTLTVPIRHLIINISGIRIRVY